MEKSQKVFINVKFTSPFKFFVLFCAFFCCPFLNYMFANRTFMSHRPNTCVVVNTICSIRYLEFKRLLYTYMHFISIFFLSLFISFSFRLQKKKKK